MATTSQSNNDDAAQAAPKIRNKVGRPRAFQDEDVYRVMMRVISEVGYARLTFALIAAEIKCTTSALIRRFGDKKSLVQGFISWVTHQQESFFNQYETLDLAPLDVLRARIYLPVAGQPDDERIHIQDAELYLAFFIEARSEPAYRPQLDRLTHEFEILATETVKAAVEAGQIKACDEAELAHLIVVTMIGAQSVCLDQKRGSMIDEMERVWDSLMAPYLA
jgi:AcrR family transcriptional regulator